MTIKIDKEEAGDLLVKHLKTMFPNMLVVATSTYGDFEFEVTSIEEKKPVE